MYILPVIGFCKIDSIMFILNKITQNLHVFWIFFFSMINYSNICFLYLLCYIMRDTFRFCCYDSTTIQLVQLYSIYLYSYIETKCIVVFVSQIDHLVPSSCLGSLVLLTLSAIFCILLHFKFLFRLNKNTTQAHLTTSCCYLILCDNYSLSTKHA